MKRIVCLILAVCLTGLFAVSCSDDGDAGPIGVIFFGSDTDTYGIDLSGWARSLRENHEEESAPKSAEIELLGKKFSGEYLYSSVMYPARHMSHFYKGEYWTFAVNAETGEVDSFNVGYEKTDETHTADECRKVAQNAASRFIDLNEYTLDVSEAEDKYVFRYTKYVEGLPTRDILIIGISMYNGGFCTLSGYLTGSFEVTPDTSRAVRRLKAADKESLLSEKVQSMFTGEYQWSHDDYVACILPGGTVALYTKVTVNQQLEDEADGEKYTYPSTSAFDAFIIETPEGYVASAS